MEATIFKRKKDGVLFFLAFYSIAEGSKAEFMNKERDEVYKMDEVIRNVKEFEMVAGDQNINQCWTAVLDGETELFRVNNWGELIRNPRVKEGKFYYMNGKRNRIDSIGSWDENAVAYRVMYGGQNGGACFDTDFWIKPNQKTL